jgi:hypothetical protein
MTVNYTPELEQELDVRLQHAFAKRFRLVAENENGQFSGTWMFWGNRSDFYFGAKSILGAFKVSFHENGVGYVAFHKPYLETKSEEGIALPSKTILEWKLPVPSDVGAVHAASLILPAEFCRRSRPLSQRERANTLIFGVKDRCAAEIGLFLSREDHTTLEVKLVPLGHPIVMVTLENGLKVSVVARSRDFDPGVLPTTEQMKRARMTALHPQDMQNTENLNAVIWNKPEDGGTLQVIDIGGVRLEHRPQASAL